MTADVEARVLSFLGLCMRAGQLTSGQEACVNAVREGGAKLVLLDEGASENTRKRLADACHNHQVPLYQISKNALGHAIGKAGRMVVCLPDGGMAQKLQDLLGKQQQL